MKVEALMQATGSERKHAEKFAPIIGAAMKEFEINTPRRIAMFLAQIGHESGHLRYTREIWGPTPTQLRYEGRKDLGNTEPGDGKRFMGRGLIQTTGRANYTATGAALGLDLLNRPELLEEPANAARSAAWFWKSRGLNELADVGDFMRITRRINGGLNGHIERMALYEKAQDVKEWAA